MTFATCEVAWAGLEVTGIYDGFEHLMKGCKDRVHPITIREVATFGLARQRPTVAP